MQQQQQQQQPGMEARTKERQTNLAVVCLFVGSLEAVPSLVGK